jgi:hypothetical protein
MSDIPKADRDALIRVARARAKQAEADARAKVLLADVLNDITAEYNAHDALWADAVAIAEGYAAKANAQIQVRCAELGVPPAQAPGLELGWRRRSAQFSDQDRRSEVRKLAEARLDALTQNAKTAIRASALDVEEQLILGGLESAEAKEFLAALPTVVQLMPPLAIEDLGVVRWQPPEDAAARLTTWLSPADRRDRRVLRAIEANPGASDRRIAEIAGVDHKTVAAYRRERGEIATAAGEIPSPGGVERHPSSRAAGHVQHVDQADDLEVDTD